MTLPDPHDRPWLTVAEVALITGEGEKAIRVALDAGQLPLLQIGRYKRIPTARLYEQLGMDSGSVCIRPQHAPVSGETTVRGGRPALSLANRSQTEVDSA
jgi:hypothetical protein